MRGENQRSTERGAAASPKLIKLALCSWILIVLLASMLDQVNGQFFTKSSKSIPRMGRRSLPEYQNAMEAYRQLLADEYDEQQQQQQQQQKQQQQIAYQNEDLPNGETEPIRSRLADMIRSRPRASDVDYTAKMLRDGRSNEFLD